MPRQNRVTPDGEIIATPARGTLMGNRGTLHDDQGRIVTAYEIRRWIYCRLEFKGRRREIMQPGSYTELFFLDEATALAAGHRPCAECMRERYNAFRAAWVRGSGGSLGERPPKAPELDARLHRDRLSRGVRRTYRARLADLPEGTFLRLDRAGQPHMVGRDGLAPWAPAGYGVPATQVPDMEVEVITPASVVAAFRCGFQPIVHETEVPERSTNDRMPQSDLLGPVAT